MKYISKPEEVDAIQLKDDNLAEVIEWLSTKPQIPWDVEYRSDLVVQTPNGLQKVMHGEYLIRLQGEAELVSQAMFEQHFFPVDENKVTKLNLVENRRTLGDWFKTKTVVKVSGHMKYVKKAP